MHWVAGFLVVAIVAVACGSSQTTPTQITPPVGGSTISASQAISHVGERATVCGDVVDSRYARSSRGSPTFLNFDRPFPNHIFTVVIWGSERSAFPSSPEVHYRSQEVCATGLIEMFQGKPQIIARDPSQLQVR
jgi:hypothetical protein